MAGTALVIGASSLIGRAISIELANLNYGLELWGRDRVALEQTAGASDPAAQLRLVDVTDVDQVRSALGSGSSDRELSVVVYAAGVFDWGPLQDASVTSVATSIATNLTGAAIVSTLALPILIASAPSSLIFIGSAASSTAYPNNAAYVAAKHGLRGLARSTFLDVRSRDVKVSIISPGLVAAGAGLASGAAEELLLQPQDVAAAVRFVVTFPARGCPTEIRLQPQRDSN